MSYYASIGDNLTFKVAAAIICLTCLFYSTMMRRRSRLRNRLFTMLVSFTLIDSVADIINYFLIDAPMAQSVKYMLVYFLEMVYFFAHFALIPIFVFYIILVCGIRYKLSRYQRTAIIVPFYILEVVLVSNPFTEIVFSISNDLQFERRVGIYVEYALSAFYLLLSIWLLINYRFTIDKLKKIAMLYFLALVFFGTFVQMLYPAIACELICEAIGLMGIMIMIEKDDDRTDAVTNTYNRNAFVQDVRNFFMLERRFVTICVRIENLEVLRKIYDHYKIDKLLRDVADYIMAREDNLALYHISANSFFIINTEKGPKAIDNQIKYIVERFDKTWKVEKDDVKLDIRILQGESPAPFDKLDDLFLLATTNLENTEKKVLKGEDLGFLLRRFEVEKAIGRGISEKNFLVTYRPLYMFESKKIKAAEVVLKLKDKELGEIKSEEFLSIADESGFIEELQMRTIEAVCRFLSSGVDTSDMQLDFVIIPIMSIRMANENLVRKVNEYIEHFKVNPELFAFEISENLDFYGHYSLEEMIDGFSKLGIRLFINNYESAFLGLNPSASYRFDGAIINVKDIFRGAYAENCEIILSNRTNMIRQLEKTIIISGVDSYECYSRLYSSSADYLCGDILCVPISKNELQNKFWHGERLVIADNKVERVEEDADM